LTRDSRKERIQKDKKDKKDIKKRFPKKIILKVCKNDSNRLVPIPN